MTRSVLGVGSFGLVVALGMTSAVVAQEQPAGEGQELPQAHRRSLVGEPAPVLSLTDCAGKTHSLQDYRGKVVILAWIDPTNELWIQQQQDPAVKKDLERYEARGVVYLPIFAFSGAQATPGQQPATPEDWQQGVPPGQWWTGPGGQEQSMADGEAQCGADAGACSVVKALDERHALEACERLARSPGFDAPILLDVGGRVTRRYGVERLPHAVIVDKQGLVVHECGAFEFMTALERALGDGRTLPASAPRTPEEEERRQFEQDDQQRYYPR